MGKQHLNIAFSCYKFEKGMYVAGSSRVLRDIVNFWAILFICSYSQPQGS